MAAKVGDRVRVEYIGTLDDGAVFDIADEGSEPFIFTIGSGDVLRPFEETVIGMEPGEVREVTVESQDAYGEADPELLRSLPRENFPVDADMEEGTMILITLPDGQEIPAVISEIGEDEVMVDLNHPLCGLRLHFKVTLLEIISS